jgi:EAL domain-containing protein (putative c-di-GMP-specific phosphodiesterase class I)
VLVGYEALTRFADGSDPEVLFAEVAAVGLGAELETPTLQAALEAAESLPRSAWLNLNASPKLTSRENRCAPSSMEAADASFWK